MLPFTNTGERGVAVRDGVAGRKFTGADSGFRRTACIHPRLRVSARIRFAVILLSKAMDVVRDHLIHRKRSPFPYEGKALTPLKVGEAARSGTRLHAPRRGARLMFTSSTAERSSFPSRGRTLSAP